MSQLTKIHGTATPGGVARIQVDGVAVATGVVNDRGEYSVFVQLTPGRHRIKACCETPNGCEEDSTDLLYDVAATMEASECYDDSEVESEEEPVSAEMQAEARELLVIMAGNIAGGEDFDSDTVLALCRAANVDVSAFCESVRNQIRVNSYSSLL